MTLIIHSRPGQHRALLPDNREIGPVATEIALVELLAKKNIYLRDWRCTASKGHDFVAVSTWEKKKQ
jgi:hypothetical protein